MKQAVFGNVIQLSTILTELKIFLLIADEYGK
jgi:hypothetical protein